MIQALIPGIHGRPTGGNLFNRNVLAYLEGVTEVEVCVVAEGAPLPAPRGDLTLVDSLLLRADLPAGPAPPRVLLAHYLHLFEPRLQGSAEAERERDRLADLGGVIATSHFCRDLLIAEGTAPDRVAAVTPGLGAGFFAAPGRREPDPAPRLLTVATLLEGKGLERLLAILEACADLAWTWEVAGDPGLDPDFSASFQARVAGSPMAERVRLLGAVTPERMVEVYDRATIFVLPSRFESCSIATMEAMARGLPVLAFRVGGIPERVPPPNAGLLAPPEDDAALAASLRRLLADPAQALAIGGVNRSAAKAFPTWEQCGAAVWEFLRQIR